MIYTFNNTSVDTETYLLLVDGKETSVEPQVFSLIVYLIQNKDKVVTRDELLAHVWNGRIVSDTSINNNIKSARKALGDDGTKQHVIKTIHSRGYQFVAVTDNTAATPTDNSKNVAQQLIAVLPFTNTKPNAESDYLSFALANQIIGDLSYLENFSVRPAGSVSKYVNQVIDPIDIGKQLQVDYVICGNYLLDKNSIRLSVELIQVDNNSLVWRESMQVDYADTLALQDMVAQKVAHGLDTGFRHNFINQQRRDIPNNALAFEYYLRGISYPQSNDGHKMAIEMLRKSIELDPQYAPSYAHLGFHLRLMKQHGRIDPKGFKEVEWYYLKALELNPVLLEALSNLSGLYTETNRIEEALLIIRKMLEINPNDAHSHFSLSYIYRYAGMLDESIDEAETALTISPDNSRFRSIIAAYVSAGRYQDALKKVYLDKGDYGIGYSGLIAFKQGKLDRAKGLFKQVTKIDPNGIWGLIAQFYLAVMDGNHKLGLEVLTGIADSDVIDAENMYHLADFYGTLNEKEACLDMLEQAINSGYFNYPAISKNSSFKFLKADIRYSEILKNAQQRHDAFRTNFL